MMKKRRFTQTVIICALLCFVSPLYADTPWLHTDANLIKDPNGNVVVLRGLDTIDIGAAAVYGELPGLIDMVTNKSDSQGNSPGWYPRVLRLAVYPAQETDFSSPFTFDPNDSNEAYYNYLLRPVVDYCKTKDLYVIIDWHFVGDNTYDRVAETNAFWSYMAPKFAGDSHVLFELFNEPGNTSGGSDAADWATCKPNMQTWIDIIRASAPNNLILVGAPRWCQEVGPAADSPLAGTNLVMVVHLYPGHWTGLYGNPEWYKNEVRHCITRYPMFATEWGFRGSLSGNPNLQGTIANYGQPLMDFYEGYKISNSAWITDNSWQPQMFDLSWNLLVGPGEMGGFVKDTLYAKMLYDQPGANATPPAAPTGLSATPGNALVSLNWNDNNESDLAGYNVYRSTASGGPYTKINEWLLSNSDYIDSTTLGGVTYYYVVTAMDLYANESGNSNQVSARPTDTIPPAAPTGLTAKAGDNYVSLNWNDNSEVDINGYNVYRSTISGGTYTRLNGTLLSNSDYIDYTAVNGTTYYYVVTAVDTSSNESANSSEATSMGVEIIGSWVTGTTHTKETGSNRALIFIAHARYLATTLTSVTYGGQAMTKVIDTNSGGTIRASATVFILNETGVAAATNSTFVPTWSTTPNPVAYTSVFLKNVNQATLVGASDSNSTRSSTPNPINTNPLSTSVGDMVIDAATCGNTGSYTMNNGFIESTNQTFGGTGGATGATGYKTATGAAETPSATHSNPNIQVIVGFVVKISPNLPPSAPTGLSAAAGNHTVSLDWNNNGESDLAGYNVYRSTTSGSGYVKLNGSLLTSSDYNDSNVSNGTTYYYVVTAVDTGTLESGYSNEVSATPNYPSTGTGAILREWWAGITGTAVSDLTSNVNYPDNSTGRELITKLQGPTNWADNYGTSIRGYVIPPVNGSYTFWIASDANSELWLSTNNNPANAILIAYIQGNPQSSPKSLVAGQKYYVEVLHKAGTGNDNISVSWQGPGISQQVIDGLYLSPCCLDFRDFADLAQQWNRSDCNAGNNWCSGEDRDRDGNVQIDDLKTFAEEWLTGF
ncbi:MAG: cellulase family glycosylhydrolase [Sedimentisphaerales bacterium]|jgi:fibronectin type 3 domain-containing protein